MYPYNAASWSILERVCTLITLHPDDGMYPCNAASWRILEGVCTLIMLHPGAY